MLHRDCAYCKKTLTDMASLQAGVGPDCRKKTNHLFATTLPANLPRALAELSRLKVQEWPSEAAAYFAEHLLSLADHIGEEGLDLRPYVEALTWLTSAGLGEKVRDTIAATITHLGYPVVASMILGSAASSEAVITIDTSKGSLANPGFIRIKAVQNPKAKKALYALGGAYYNGGWGFPLKAAEALSTVFPVYYPWFKFEGVDGWTGIVAAREAFLLAFKAVMLPPAMPTTLPPPMENFAILVDSVEVLLAKKGVVVSPIGSRKASKTGVERFGIRAPYNGAWVVKLKGSVPESDRHYSAVDYTWEIDAPRYASIVALAADQFLPKTS